MLLTETQQQELLRIARRSIENGLQTNQPLPIDVASFPAEMTVLQATFVTLQKNHALRGCIGALQAHRPLVKDIADNAFAAAFKDHRFPPVRTDELAELDIHLSLLTPSEPVCFSSEHDLISQLQPGVDGLILQEGSRRGTFLPSVWATLPQPNQFLRHLKQKAGLPPDYWSDTLKIYRYRTEMIG